MTVRDEVLPQVTPPAQPGHAPIEEDNDDKQQPPAPQQHAVAKDSMFYCQTLQCSTCAKYSIFHTRSATSALTTSSRQRKPCAAANSLADGTWHSTVDAAKAHVHRTAAVSCSSLCSSNSCHTYRVAATISPPAPSGLPAPKEKRSGTACGESDGRLIYWKLHRKMATRQGEHCNSAQSVNENAVWFCAS